MTVSIRPARLEDIPHLITLGCEMCKESPVFSKYTPDFGRQGKVFKHMIESEESLVLIASDLSAMFVGHINQLLWHKETIAVEDVLFVSECFRKSRRAKLLVDGFVEWAKGKCVFEIRVGISTMVDVDRTIKFYNKYGFETFCTLMRK